MSDHIQAQPIDAFNGGKWCVMIVTEAGTLPVRHKDGVTDVPYSVGSAILVNERQEVIAGPVSRDAAVDLAERVLDCNERVRTDTATILCLATAMVAFTNVATTLPPQAAQSALVAATV